MQVFCRYCRLSGDDKGLYEAGAIDGIRNRYQEFWFITLPAIKPQLMFGAVMSVTSSFAAADIMINLAGFPSTDYAAHTIVTHLQDYGFIRYDMGYACAIATILFLMMVFVNKLGAEVNQKGLTVNMFRGRRLNRSAAVNALNFLLLMLLGAFMALPFVYVLNNAFKPLDELFIYPPRLFVQNRPLTTFLTCSR